MRLFPNVVFEGHLAAGVLGFVAFVVVQVFFFLTGMLRLLFSVFYLRKPTISQKENSVFDISIFKEGFIMYLIISGSSDYKYCSKYRACTLTP